MSGLKNNNDNFYIEIKTLLVNAKNKVYQTINTTMTETYWQIGHRIVEEEQNYEPKRFQSRYIKARV